MTKNNTIPPFEAISGRDWLSKDGDAYISWAIGPLGEAIPTKEALPGSPVAGTEDIPAVPSFVPGFSAGFSFHNGRDTIVQSWQGTTLENLREARGELFAVVHQLLTLEAEIDKVLGSRKESSEE